MMMPHGWCVNWNPFLVALLSSSDGLIALAYFIIPFVLLIMKPAGIIKYPGYAAIFGIFIMSCGIGHVLDVVSIWYPIYWVKGWWNVITAFSSLATAVIIVGPVMRYVTENVPENW